MSAIDYIIEEMTTFSYIQVAGLNQDTSTDTIRYFFDNKKRCKYGEVYFVDRLNKKECEVFFISNEVISDFEDKSFCIDKTNITIVEEGPVYKDKIFVQNIHRLTTKDGLKCFFQAQTGKDVLIQVFNKSNGKAIIEFVHTPDFAALDTTCKKESLDSNYLKIKPLKSSKTIVVSGCNHNNKDDLLFYFDNTKQAGGVDVEKVTKINDETYLVLFMSSKCVIDVCKRKHSLKDRDLKVQEYYQCMASDDEFGMLTSGDGLSKNNPENLEHGRNTTLAKKRKRNNSESPLMTKSTLYDRSFRENEAKPWSNKLESDTLINWVQSGRKKMKKDINNTSLSSKIVKQDEKEQESVDTQVETNQSFMIDADSNKNDKCHQQTKDTNCTSEIKIQSSYLDPIYLKEESRQLDKSNAGSKETFNFQHDDKGTQGPMCMSKTEAKTKEVTHTNRTSEITIQSSHWPSSIYLKEESKQLDKSYDESKETFNFQHDDKGAQGPMFMSKTEAKTKEVTHTKHTSDITIQSSYWPSFIYLKEESKQLDKSNDESKESFNFQHDDKGAQGPMFMSKTEAKTKGVTRAHAPKCMRKSQIKGKKVNHQVQSRSKAKSNVLPYIELCMTLACVGVQQYFTRKVPESMLEFHLKIHMHNLMSSVWKCTNDQQTVLFPVLPDRVDSSKFDFPLLYKLIRYTITPLSQPTQGWGSRPLPGDITEEDDIERIRHFLANNTSFSLTDCDFKNVWSDFSQAIIRLSREKLSAEIMNLSKLILEQHTNQEISENLLQNIENMTEEIRRLHQDTFQEEKLRDIPKKTGRNDHASNVKGGTGSHNNTGQLPFLKEHKEFNVPTGAKTREIRDCTAIPGVGWIISDCNNSELIKIDRKLCISIYAELPKPMFVTCFDGDVAVSVFNDRKITVFDKNTWSVKNEIRTEESVLGITNMRKRLLVRAGNIGFRFISPNHSDPLIRIEGDNMPYIAVWKNMIFLTNWKTDEIYCYNTAGELQWIFRNSKLKSPNGVSTDKEGNIFIVGSYSHNICILSSNYKETKGYRFEDAGMKYPIAIDYDKSSSKFIVCNLKGMVKLFDLVAGDKYPYRL